MKINYRIIKNKIKKYINKLMKKVKQHYQKTLCIMHHV